MSEKRQVPTFKVYLSGVLEAIEGPVVAPAKTHAATNMTELHEILHTHHALLVYARKWVYVPLHAITHIERGANRFSLPWPLTDE